MGSTPNGGGIQMEARRHIVVNAETFKAIKDGAQVDGVTIGRYVARLLVAKWVLQSMRDEVQKRSEANNGIVPVV
jgi:hypothetical protein